MVLSYGKTLVVGLVLSLFMVSSFPAAALPFKVNPAGLSYSADFQNVRYYRHNRHRHAAPAAILGILALGTAAAVASSGSRYDNCGYYNNCGYGGRSYYNNSYYAGRGYSQYPHTRDYYGGYGHSRHYYGSGNDYYYEPDTGRR